MPGAAGCLCSLGRVLGLVFSPLKLCYHTTPKRGRPQNSFSGSQAVYISCGSTLETQQLFWGLGGLRAFGGQVGKGKGCSSSLQQIALDLNKNFRCGIEILYFLFP